ncbi:2OG-Fe(II) oxygenase [Maricaulis sp. CAU 1757]
MFPEYSHLSARCAALLGPYVNQPTVGDFASDFECLDPTGRTIRLFDDAFAGRPIVLALLNEVDASTLPIALPRLAGLERQLAVHATRLVVVSACTDNALTARLAREAGLATPVLGDGTGALLARYGLLRGDTSGQTANTRLLLISANGQILTMTDYEDGRFEHITAQLDGLNSAGRSLADKWIPGHAPILAIPNALDPDDCVKLIDHYGKSDDFRVARPGAGDPAEYKFAASDYNRQDRIDQIIRDTTLNQLIDERINTRVLPQIAKAFAFQVTRREAFHVARYQGAREGIAIGHRDNTHASTRYRRFALSVSLNDDYEGGELVFREYAGKGYRGAVGTAFVFSSSLLHEVEETTRGTRYNLISHFFDDAATGAR